MTEIQLRPYQREAVDAVHAAAERNVGRPAIGLPTGTGKTIVFGQAIRERGYPALILAHRDELIQQAVEKYQMIDPAAWVGIVKAGDNQLSGDVVVASVQTLSREGRLAQLAGQFKTAVVDEAHHATAATYARIMGRVAADGCPLTLGVSATLERGDKVGLGHAWDEVVYFKTLREMIEAGYLVDIRALEVKLRVDFRLLRVSHGDFTGSSVETALRDAHAAPAAVSAYEQHAAGRKAIAFTPTVATAYDMAAAFEAAGIPAAAIDHTTPTADRRAVLRAFADGSVRVVANAMILTEGFDEPSVDCIIVARPTRNRPLYVQMVGRGTRLYPGKDDLLVIDLVGNADRVDLVTLPRLFGLKPHDVAGGARGAVEALRTVADRAAAAAGLVRAPVDAHAVDLFDRKDVNWLHLADGRWVLDVGDSGSLALVPDAGRWKVLHTRYDRGSKRETRAELAADLDLGYAMGVAEERLRGLGGDILVSREAPWRQKPASPKQLEWLARKRIPHAPDITRGEAADLLTAAFA